MTLWDFQKVMRHALNKVLAELQRLLPNQTETLSVDQMIATRNQVAHELKGKVWQLEEVRRLAFERTLAQINHPDKALAVHLNTLYLQHRFEDIELYKDVVPALDALTPHFKIGLLSNGNSYPQRCGLQGYFAFVVFSQDVGVEKPARRIFELTAQQAGCQLDQLLHVGDSLENDVAGANNAGVRSVWLNRDRKKNETAIQADFEVASLTEVPDLLSG